MGYRPNRYPPMRPAEGACTPGHRHHGEPVVLMTGDIVGHVCAYCLVRLKRVDPPPPYAGPANWRPYSDDGRPLPELPDPGYTKRP